MNEGPLSDQRPFLFFSFRSRFYRQRSRFVTPQACAIHAAVEIDDLRVPILTLPARRLR